MKTKKILLTIAIACFVITGCKKEVKKEIKKENVSLAISGMTCEIGCAKTIQSKLSKKEGVLNAKVVFTDSIANIAFDANTTSKKDLIAFIDGIAGGELYKASETTEMVNTNAKKSECCKKDSKGNMLCLKDCKMACCADKNS
jgi:copper chaperone CopZ